MRDRYTGTTIRARITRQCWIAMLVGLVLPFECIPADPQPQAPEVSRETALAMPDAELAATCNRATVARKYVDLARAGASVTIGRRRVTSRNADAVAADIDAQLDVCREAIAERGVARIGGVWTGSSAGCERAGSLLAQALKERSSGVRFEQDGIMLAVTVFGRTSDGEDFSFPASGTVVGHYVAMIDPGNSDYLLQGEATEAAIVLRPDAESILAAWPAWAGPPKREDLASCVVSLQRSSGDSAPTVAAPEPYRNPYEGLPRSTSPFTDPSGLLPKAEARQLNAVLESLWKKRRLAISVLLMESLPSESVESFTKRVVHAGGTGGARGGAVLVLVHSNTSAHLAVGGEEAEIITPEKAANIVDRDVLPAMRAGRVHDAIQAAITSIVAALDAR